MRLISSGAFKNKNILLVEKNRERKNDRTWCFWEKSNGFFESIVFRKWADLELYSDDFSSTLQIAPYQYKMIRGADFYHYCFDEIKRQTNIDIRYGTIQDRVSDRTENLVLDDGVVSIGDAIVFNSIYQYPSILEKGELLLLQHFKGWTISTSGKNFDPGKAILMDFRVHQQHGTSFAYMLPFSENQALVEYTLFTPSLLAPDMYNKELKTYIESILGIDDYHIDEEEFGVIPMTSHRFDFFKDGVYNIGTAGGQTKASSGYTFQFIQKQSQQIVDCLIQGKSLRTIASAPRRFRFYDNTLLHILYHKKLSGKKVFTDLFKKNPSPLVLKFLDNETSIKEEISIISSLPTWPFLRSAILH